MSVISDPRGVDPKNVDLDVSRMSAASTASSITLGGKSYPIGSTVGTSGLFVIGDPGFGAPRETSSTRSSLNTLNTAAGSGSYLISEKYDFEDWNWPVIRFTCLGVLIAIMIGLLAAVVAVGIQGQSACNLNLDWWQGSVIYHINVPRFTDATRDGIGDIQGVQERIEYFKFLGIGAICLNHFLPTIQPRFDVVTSFKDIDSRLGTKDDLRSLASALHRNNIKLMLEFEPIYTSHNHDWFQESRSQSATIGNEYKDIYFWVNQPPQNHKLKWTLDPLRNQFYMNFNDSDLPIINWANKRVAQLFESELRIWADLGVDGFYIRGIGEFYMISNFPRYGALLSYLDSWSTFLNEESTLTGARALMVDGSFLDQVYKANPDLVPAMLTHINLVDVQLDAIRNNISGSLRATTEFALKNWQMSPKTWVSFHIGKFNNVIRDLKIIPAIETLIMVLPGTPAIIAGQEVGEDPYDETYQGTRIQLIEWVQPGAGQIAKPYKKGSILDVRYLDSLRSIIRLHTLQASIRADVDGINRNDNSKHLGVEFIDAGPDMIFVKRFYYKQNTYFYILNLGENINIGDWSEQTSLGFFILETLNENIPVQLKTNALETKPGQGILFYVPL